MKNIYFFLISFFALSLNVTAQINFQNANDRFSIAGFRSGVAMGVADVNGDGLDDIIRMANAQFLNIELQSNSSPVFLSVPVGQTSNSNNWSLCAGDIDNSGYLSVIAGGAYNGVHLAKAEDESLNFTLTELPGQGLFVQGSNLVDINNDGFLDYFACHDDAESRIWQNDGNGNFEAADYWIDMKTTPTSDNSGNYGSIWTDFDNDGDLDLYIAKCRLGVNSPDDPRRINALYVNDGNGNFAEAADTYNLKIGAQSWTADFQDIDNDGDFDCLITNHDVPSMLLENDGNGYFTDITATSGLNIGGTPVQGIMRDFDNDGFVDVLIGGSIHYLFKNNGDKTFTEVPNVFGNDEVESFAVGDLNHDGALDVYAGYANLYNTPSNINDVLWLQEAGDNNFVSFRLEGVQSNRSGVGARVELFGAWGMQTREVRAGESYGIMNSLQQHFGVGQNATIDSVRIHWPSGTVDVHENLLANQFYHVIENTCISSVADIQITGETVFCEGEIVTLEAPAGQDYEWSNGANTAAIEVGEAGIYNVTITNAGGCTGVSPSVELIVNPDETPHIEVLSDSVFCQGGKVVLQAMEPATAYMWSTGSTADSLVVTETGDYTLSIEGLCETFTSAPVHVEVLEAPAPMIDEFTIDGTEVFVSLTGDSVQWFAALDSPDPIQEGNELSTTVAGDTTLIYYAENTTVYPGPSYAAGMENHQGSNYSGNQFNGDIVFDAYVPFLLQTVKVITDTEGPRIIELRDADGQLLLSKEVDIPVGESIVILDFDIPVGSDMALTTNTDFNLANFGYESARLRRSSQNVNYPYEVPGVLSMTTSNFGSARYYYFFDWQIKLADVYCTSERVEIPLVVVQTDAADELSDIQVYPNPASKQLNIDFGNRLDGSIQFRVFHASGQLMATYQVEARSTHQISLADWPSGMYLLEITQQERRFTQSFIISR
ncbi:MAG: FG-GAP-like repeat-containing protein [Saprospiraceae bacterium]|nr:FG-GAP-like repeat-containing protein [Saprospiraceae bacterium]